ncbi:MAG: c-type cytochrome [Janthinobacterium lividum]
MKLRLLGTLAGLGTLGLVILGAAPGHADLVVPEQTAGKAPDGPKASPELIARGEHLTTMGDCVGCHSANGGKHFAGGQYMGMPFGDISTPNITPDTETGIGRYTDADFLKLMHHGVTPEGMHIYPAMPYPWYATVKDDDVLAIKAYLFSLDPVHAPRRPNKIWFPFNLRPVLALWDAAFVPGQVFKPDPKLTDEQNLGAYIVNGLEHCGECHNNRNFLGNTKVALEVKGGPITMWYAPNLRSDKVSGIGGYTDDQVVQWLHDGHSEAMGTVAGPMAEVIDYSTKKLEERELRAIVSYLRTLPPAPSYEARQAPPDSRPMVAGRTAYLSNCASCHQVDGKGLPGKIPALDGNGMVRAFGPQSVIRVILGGLEARGPFAPMPGVGAGMTNQQVADAANYVRQAWSNAAPANATPFLAGFLRSDTSTLLNGARPDGCPVLVQEDLRRIIDDKSTGVADLLHNMTLPTMLQTTNAILAKVKADAPNLEQADIVNGLTIAYCPIANADTTLDEDSRHWATTHFAERVYVQLTTKGAY